MSEETSAKAIRPVARSFAAKALASREGGTVLQRITLSRVLGARKAVAINRLLTVWLCALILFDFAFNRRADIVLDAVISLPLATLFAVASTRLAQGACPSPNWLVLSGATCVLFGAVSALSIWTAVEVSPVDYACAFWATTMAGIMGYAAWYQLRLSSEPTTG